MSYIKVELCNLSGTNWGVNGFGILVTTKDTFIHKEEQYRDFPGILFIRPESNVDFSSSGCLIKTGASIFTY